jgi:hypothetical protein
MVPALRALKARGFLSVLDMTATSAAAAGQEALTIESGLRCLRLPLDLQGLQAAVVQEFIATVREGIVAVFADDPRVVGGLVAVLCERGMLNDFSDTETLQLEQWAGESIAAMRGIVEHALMDR